MKCSTELKKVNPDKLVYNISDYEIRNGVKVKLNIVITPLEPSEPFYYLNKLENGKYELMGEGWIFENQTNEAIQFARRERERWSKKAKIKFFDDELNEVKI